MKSQTKFDIDYIVEQLRTKSIHDKVPYVHPIKTKNKTINLSIGRIFFNEHLPDDYPLVDEPVNMTLLNQTLENLSNKYSTQKACEVSSKLQQDAFRIGTLSPSTFSVDVFIPPDEWMEKKKAFEIKAVKYSPTQFQEEAGKLTKELVAHIEKKGFRIHNVLSGGVKGNPIDDWKNLLVGKGYIIDIENNLLGPVVHGISEGFTKQEYFDSVAEARRGFYYKASLTAIPGYLARKLAMASANITLADKDCKTKKYYELYITPDNIDRITGRYFVEDGNLVLSTSENLAKYIGKTIQLRSPLFCQSKNNQICPICFGTLAGKLDATRLGILAAGVINLITINALMKMRHKTSQINAKEVDFPALLSKTSVNIELLSAYLDIQKNVIKAKQPVRIIVDQKDYNDNEILETSEYYMIPGILDVSLNEKTVITLPFEFMVKVFKPMNYTFEKSLIYFDYETGEKILSQEHIIESTDPTIIRKLFDAGFKYFNTPQILVENIFKQMSNCDLNYIELIVQNMFRSKINTSNSCRLVNYKDCEMFSQKQLPFLNSWLNSIAFESINKGIKNGLMSDTDIRYDPIEKIVIEKFI